LPAGQAVFFDATDPGPSPWSLVGSNPSELQVQPGEPFRMMAFAVRGSTVVLVIRSQSALAELLPAANRLLAALRFPA
jgi:hypothetical protein